MSVLSLSLMSMAQAGEVKKVMKDMKIAMQQAMDSKSMPEFSRNFHDFKMMQS
jgi:soluble cytochrome b562